jgi:class 3 adenylate cyclase
MNGALAFMNAAVGRYGATVARLKGDATLALFGTPVALEDDAQRAVRAGLEMQARATEFTEAVRRRYEVQVQVWVGVHAGLAVLAMVGNELKTECTAMGDTASVAARQQSTAEPGTVLLSADTFRARAPLWN